MEQRAREQLEAVRAHHREEREKAAAEREKMLQDMMQDKDVAIQVINFVFHSKFKSTPITLVFEWNPSMKFIFSFSASAA